MTITEPRTTFVAFQECEIRGSWEGKIQDALDRGLDPEDIHILKLERDSSERYTAMNENCELWVIRPDGLRKAWVFKKDATIVIRASTVKFHQSMVDVELSVDEKEQSGR
ncbi:MAG: hypothetical protein J4F36_13180 [Nitrosopumilaceae archaeon]|nr:hypothetical protein [Nitrosopumilaceae archaeon]